MIGSAPFPPSNTSLPHAGMSNLLNDCALVDENAAVFALGALGDEEEMQVTRHCAVCPRCALLLAQARSAVSFLPFMVEPVEAPVSAKTALFARIATQHQPAATNHPAASVSIWTAPSSEPTLTLPSSRAAAGAARGVVPPVTPARPRVSSWNMLIAPLAAIPLVIALAIVGGWAMHAQARLQDQRTVMTKMQRENEALSAQVSAPVGRAAPMANIARTFTMTPPRGAKTSTAGGTLSAAPGSSNVQLLVWNLPTTPANPTTDFRVEVEATDGGKFTAGTVTIGQDGRGSASLDFRTPIDTCRFVHIVPMIAVGGGAANSTSPVDVLVGEINGSLGENSGTDAYLNAH